MHKMRLCNAYLSRVSGIIKLRRGHTVGIINDKCKQNFYLETEEDLRLHRGYCYGE
jgi:hypothetical protein